MNVKGKTLLEKIGSFMPKPKKTKPDSWLGNTAPSYEKTLLEKALQKKRSNTNPKADAASKKRNEDYGKAMNSAYKNTQVFGKIK